MSRSGFWFKFLLWAIVLPNAIRADDMTVISEFVNRHCISCHGAETMESDIDLRDQGDQHALLKNRRDRFE